MSWSHSVMLDTLARLRLACRALTTAAGEPITPDQVTLADLDSVEREALLAEAREDLWRILQQAPRTEAKEPTPYPALPALPLRALPLRAKNHLPPPPTRRQKA